MVLVGEVCGGRIFFAMKLKILDRFPRRILRVLSTVINFGLTSALNEGSTLTILSVCP